MAFLYFLWYVVLLKGGRYHGEHPNQAVQKRI